METERDIDPAPADGAGASLARMRTLLDRPLSPEDIATNTALVAARSEAMAVRMSSVLVFRIGEQRLALGAEETHRVVPVSAIRRVPHRSNAVFAGIASVAGELTPVASIGAALGIAGGAAATHFIVIGAPGSRWAFAVDGIEGVRRVDASRAVAAPTTVRHAADGCTDRLVPVAGEGGEALVGVLDAGRLSALFARSLG